MVYCGADQIGRQHKGRVFWLCWTSYGLLPSWIIQGSIWRCNGPACCSKPRATPHPTPKGTQFITDWPFPPSWARILPHHFPLPPCWWGVGMGYRAELASILLNSGYLLIPYPNLPYVSPGVLIQPVSMGPAMLLRQWMRLARPRCYQWRYTLMNR